MQAGRQARAILKSEGRNFSAVARCADDVNDHHPLVLRCVFVCMLREYVRLRSGDMDIRPYGRLKEGRLL